MAVWPGSLPSPLLGLEETPPDTTLRSQTDTGPGKKRPRYSAGWRTFENYRCFVDDATKREFDDWYNNDIARGALNFSHVDPTTKAEVTMELGGPPKYRLVAPTRWEITVKLRVLP